MYESFKIQNDKSWGFLLSTEVEKKTPHINLVGYTSSRAIALIFPQTVRSTSEGLFRKAVDKLL